MNPAASSTQRVALDAGGAVDSRRCRRDRRRRVVADDHHAGRDARRGAAPGRARPCAARCARRSRRPAPAPAATAAATGAGSGSIGQPTTCAPAGELLGHGAGVGEHHVGAAPEARAAVDDVVHVQHGPATARQRRQQAPADAAVEVDDVVGARQPPRRAARSAARARRRRGPGRRGRAARSASRGARAASRSGPSPGVRERDLPAALAQARQQAQQPDLGAARVVHRCDGEQGGHAARDDTGCGRRRNPVGRGNTLRACAPGWSSASRTRRPRSVALLGLLACQSLAHEVVVVDSGSRDGGAEVAEAAGARVLHIAASEFSFGGALNLGLEGCAAPVVVALSAHAFPPDDGWLARAAACVRRRERRLRLRRDARPRRRRRSPGPCARTAALARAHPEWGYSNGAGALRTALWRERPFREDLPGTEDREWALWALEHHGAVCVLDPALAVEHDHTRDGLRQTLPARAPRGARLRDVPRARALRRARAGARVVDRAGLAPLAGARAAGPAPLGAPRRQVAGAPVSALRRRRAGRPRALALGVAARAAARPSCGRAIAGWTSAAAPGAS